MVVGCIVADDVVLLVEKCSGLDVDLVKGLAFGFS